MLSLHHLGLISRRTVLALGVSTAVIVATAGPVAAATPPIKVVQLGPSTFSTNVVGPIASWYWMSSSNYSDTATYTFSSFNPAVLSNNHKMSVFLAPLVTNDTSGGAGWGARINVKVTYLYTGGSKSWMSHVTLVNPFPIRSTLSSGGIGYQTYGSLTLNQSKFTKGAGSLQIQVTRDSSYTTSGYRPHVAVNAGALTIWYLSK